MFRFIIILLITFSFGITIYDQDGNWYETVEIGDQSWMTTSLQTTHYNDGTSIQSVNSGSVLANTDGAYTEYGDRAIYGLMYNFYVAVNERGVCPEGYHVPSLEDWQTLSDYLGGDDVSGGKLKDTNYWNEPNTGATNESGFTARPGGYISPSNGSANQLGSSSPFLTTTPATEGEQLDWFMLANMSYNNDNFSSYQDEPAFGATIRCVGPIPVEGCTDESACNYDENANQDDGSCFYFEGDTYYVSASEGEDGNCGLEDYPIATIQEAINKASEGDTIHVSEGTYYENIDFQSKLLSIIGADSNNPELTVIDGGSNESVVRITGIGMAENSPILSNFLIKSGSAAEGGGIYIYNASPHIKNCRIAGNSSSDTGGAIFARYSNVVIERCAIFNNDASVEGDVIKVMDSNAEIINSTILAGSNQCSVYLSTGAELIIENSIVWAQDGVSLCANDYELSVTYSLIGTEGGGVFDGEGNINGDPLFVDQNSENFSLQSSSPCIDAGHPDSEYDDTDGSRNDIGAYPFEHTFGCTDEDACNTDEDATINDGSCDYSCLINGDYSLRFDGNNNYVNIDDNSEYLFNHDSNDEFTYELSFSSLDWDAKDYHGLITKGYGFPNNTGWSIRVINGEIAFHTNLGGFTSSGAVNNNYLHHLALVRKENNFYLYLDGIEIATTEDETWDSDINLGDNDTQLRFGMGNYFDTDGEYLDGNIYNAKVWNVALEPSELNGNYILEDNLLADWKISFGEGDYLFDHSGNQNHGSIYYGAEWIQYIEGCTDELACNYDEGSTINDGSCVYFEGNTHYVSEDGDNNNCGLEDYPLADIQYAMNTNSADGDTIRVAAGEYQTVNLLFNGQDKNVVVIGEDKETTILNGNFLDRVVYFYNNSTSQLDNFTIKNCADDENGIYIYGATPTLSNLIFDNNIRLNQPIGGSAIYILDGGSPGSTIIDNCTFTNNSCISGNGGAIFNDHANMTITNCVFSNNSASSGGGIHSDGGNVSIENTTFSDNQGSTGTGGAIWFISGDVGIKRCVFNNNHAGDGGAISADDSHMTIENSTLACNTSDNNGSALYLNEGNGGWLDMVNSIIQFNDSNDIWINGSNYDINYSNCDDQHCDEFATNSNFDPDFVAQNNCIEPDLNLNFTSGCIDAGDPNSDLDPDGTTADMGGLYYNQSENPLPDPQVVLSMDSDSVSVNDNSFSLPVNYEIGDWYDEGLEFYSFYMKVNIDSLLNNVVASTDLDITMEQNFNSSTNNLIIAGASSSPLDELGTLFTLTIEDSQDNWEVGSVFDISITEAYFDVDEYDTILDDCQISIVSFGCTDNTACNYNGLSEDGWVDDGSCTFPSDDGQGNYGGNTTDGTSEIFDCEGSCLVDSDCLGVCGGDAVIDECGVCDGDGVDADTDNICDDVDDCVSNGSDHLVYDEDGNEVEDPNFGGYDECDQCNGPGPEFECSEEELACEISSCTLTYGDVDENGLIQPFDASYILQYINDNDLLDPESDLGYYNADVNETGDISAYDATVLLKYIVESVSELPCPTCTEEAEGLANLVNLQVEGSSAIALPINLSDAENIYSFELEFTYDSAKVVFDDMQWPDDMLGFITQHKSLPGLLKVSGATGMSPINEKDILGTIMFNQLDDFTDTEICLSKMKFNDNEAIYDRGCALIESVLSIEDEISEYSLNNCYPNPFNPETSISYDVPELSKVSISIFNSRGQLIETITNKLHQPGRYTVTWSGNNYSSGIYIVKMNSDHFNQSQKIMLIK